MFKILELKNAVAAAATEIGHGYATREEALAAINRLQLRLGWGGV